MKKIISLVLALVMLAALFACTAKTPAAEAPKTETKTETKTEAKADAPKTAESGKGNGGGNGSGSSDGLKLESATLEEGKKAIVLTFSNNVVNASVREKNAALVKLTDAAGKAVEIDVVMADDQVEPDKKRIIEVVPKTALAAGEYTLTVEAGITAKNGSELKEPYSMTFTVDKADALVVNTVILKEADDSMKNTYAVLAVNDKAPFVDANGNAVTDVVLNTAGADALYKWLNSKEALDAAAAYGVAEYGANLFYVLDDVQVYEGEIAPATEETKTIRLSTTTSVNDSGLLGSLLPIFQEKYGYKVEIYSAGTGKAISNAKMGNADMILVHAKKQEDAFVEAGFARVVEGFQAERTPFLYNFFVLCGPSEDPAKVAEAATVLDAFQAIADGKFPFISRGDNSGTHTKEISLWPKELGITAEADSFKAYTDWYISANAGMGACLVMAEQMGAYILTDKATFLSFVANGGVIN